MINEQIKEKISGLKYDDQGLIPAIIQEASTNEVLMLAYMNKESLTKTLETGQTWFYSRSRQELWNKGATSGHYQKIIDIAYDCDDDTLLIKVQQTGSACHTGQKSCFYNKLSSTTEDIAQEQTTEIGDTIKAVYEIILDRQEKRPEKSYTTYLFNEGQDKILKKIGEEATEMVIASKNNDKEEITYETSDFIYHMLVLMVYHGIKPEDLAAELNKRR